MNGVESNFWYHCHFRWARVLYLVRECYDMQRRTHAEVAWHVFYKRVQTQGFDIPSRC